MQTVLNILCEITSGPAFKLFVPPLFLPLSHTLSLTPSLYARVMMCNRNKQFVTRQLEQSNRNQPVKPSHHLPRVSSGGRRGRWGAPTMSLHIRLNLMVTQIAQIMVHERRPLAALSGGVYKVVLQKSISAQIRQLILHIGNNKE